MSGGGEEEADVGVAYRGEGAAPTVQISVWIGLMERRRLAGISLKGRQDAGAPL